MKNKIKKILITGASGTIGTRLFEKLLEKGFNVVGFDKRPNKWHKDLNKLTIIGDLLDQNGIKKIPNDFDLIIHLAANARVYDLVLEPDLARDNIISTYNILEFARKNKIKKILFSSSRETYGNKKITIRHGSGQVKSKEKEVDIELIESPYSASKIADEVLIYSYSKCYSIDYIIMRFSNVFGMYDESERFMPLIIKKMGNNENVEIFGKDKLLDFTYIDDCVDGIIKCVESFDKNKNNTFNIASGKGEKLVNVAKMIKDNLKSKSKILISKNRTGEVIKFIADISKAEKMLSYKPKYSLKESIKLTVNRYKKLWQKF
jgi:nucleoside-diphosphate-sugar epimerase